MKKLLLAAFCLFAAFSSQGQITINQNDMPHAGDELYRTRANINPFLNYQATGANYAWSFTNLTANVQDSALYQTVASTNFVYALTYADIFFNPNRANHAKSGVDIPFNNLLPIDNPYTFFYRNANEYKKVGYGVELSGIPVPIIYSTHDVIYNLPINFADTDSSFSAYNLSIPTLAYYGYEQSRVNEVDGWGTIETPAGTFDALRVKTTLYGKDTLNIDSLSIGFAIERPVIREYKWLASGYRIPVMQVNTTELFGVEIITDIYFYDELRTLNVDQPLATVLCPGDSLDVTYTETGVFNPGGFFSQPNVFRAQLSDATGSFTNPVVIGSLTSTQSDIINCIIPANTPPGTGYRIRVIATNPAFTGNDNGFDITIGGPPVATATANGSTIFCQGDSVMLSANTDVNFTYQWQLDGIDISAATNSDYTATADGDYTVVITNACGNATSQAVSVTVNELPEHSLSQTSIVICNGDQAVINSLDLSGQSPLSYQWYADGILLAGETNADITTTTAGDYTLEITNTSTGCIFTTAATNVSIDAITAPDITASGPTTFCDGGSVTIDVTVIAGINYQWQLNGTDIPGATGNSYIASAAGTYSIVATSANGCSLTSASNISVIVDPLPSAVSLISGTSTFCSGDSVTISFTDEPNVTYQWLLDGIDITGATGTSYTALAPGVYTVNATSANGCSVASLNDVTVVVNNLPVQASVIANGNTILCSNDSVTLSFSTEPGVTYQWQLDGTDISGATDSILTANVAGAYSVIATNGNGCSSVSVPVTVTVNPLPNSPAITATGNNIFCEGDSILLEITPEPGINYQWTMNGSAVTGANGSQYAANLTGTYNIIASDLNGCSAIGMPDVQVTVNPLPAIPTVTQSNDTLYSSSASSYQWYLNGVAIPGANSAYYVFTVNGDYTVVTGDVNSCTSISAIYPVTNVGISETASGAVQVYPNPSSGIFTLQGNYASAETIYEIYDVTGKLLMNGMVGVQTTMIDLTANAKGIYVMLLKSGNTNNAIKLVVQ
jgi:hypothetical protein